MTITTKGERQWQRIQQILEWSRIEAIVGSPNRMKKLAEDIVVHYETKA
ncbi:hypothetical protein [Anaerosolibacter sp.]|nr:hypothetical protein [Anaerosolibacter sp.]